MAVLSAKLRTVSTGFVHWCPGCAETHVLPGDRGWTYAGMDGDKATASPSFKHTWSERREDRCCHYILTDGVLHYCSDSTHALAGQNVPLPIIPEGERLGLPGCE